ncbi:MAG: leucine-rich repeat protein, partial [Aristaeellaceae bacterium]
DDVHTPYEDQLSYRLGRALYDTKTHRQVGTVYSRVTMYESLMVVCEVEDIVWLQSDAEDHSGWRLRVLRESDDVIPPDAPLYMAAVVEDENGEIQTAYSEGITWTMSDPKTGTLTPFTKADNWLGAVTAGYSRMKLTPLIDAGQVTLTVRHDGLGLQEKMTLQVYSDPFQYRYNDTELVASVVGYTGDRSEGVVIPATTVKNGKTYRVEAIDESAFEAMGIPWVSFPDSLEWICKDAFRNCDRLTSVNLTHVQGVETGAFSSCDSLKEVFIGSSVSTLEDGVFADCSSLTDFHCDAKNKNFRVDEESGALEQVLSSERAGNYIWREVRLVCMPAGRNHRDLTLPYEVTEISPSAFSGCTGLGDVTIANPDTSLANVRFDLTGPNLRLLVYQDSQAEKDAIARGLNHARIFDWDSDRARFLNSDTDYDGVELVDAIWTGVKKKFHWGDIERYPYYMSRAKLNNLLQGMSPVVRLLIYSEVYGDWEGSCYGMSTAALIHRYARLEDDQTYMQRMTDNLSTNNLYQLPYPKDNLTVKEYMNFYQIQTLYPDSWDHYYGNTKVIPNYRSSERYEQSQLPQEVAETAVRSLQTGIPVCIEMYGHSIVFERIKSVENENIHIQVYDPNVAERTEAVLSTDGNTFSYNAYGYFLNAVTGKENIELRNYFTNAPGKVLKTHYDFEEESLALIASWLNEYEEGLHVQVTRDNYNDYLTFFDAQDTVYVVDPREIPVSHGDAPQPLLLLDRPLPEQVTMAFSQGMAVSLLDARYPFTLEAECAGRVTVDYAARSLSVQADAPGTLQLTLAPEEGDAPGGEFVEITATDASRLTAAWSAQGLTLSSDSPEPLDVVCLDGEDAVETQVRAAGGTVGAGGIVTAASGSAPTATPPTGGAVSGKAPTATPPTGGAASGSAPTATPPTGGAAHQAAPEASGTQPYWLLLLLPAGGLLILLVVRARHRADAHKPAYHRPTGMQQASLTEGAEIPVSYLRDDAGALV